MKAYLITPMNIKYTYSGTEWHIYEYARYLSEHKIKANIIVTNTRRGIAPAKSYTMEVEARYSRIPKITAACTEVLLPFSYHLFVYRNLPKDSVIYFPYSIYDHIPNIVSRSDAQRYIIGCHGMHLKNGHILLEHDTIERTMNSIVKSLFHLKRSNINSVFFHALNSSQIGYLMRFGVRRRNIFLIPPMVKFSQYRQGGKDPKRFKVIHIGGAGKGIDITIELVEHLISKGWMERFEFHFIGVEQPERLREIAKMHKEVKTHGPIGDEEKKSLLASADAILIPAYEVFPKIALEGLASNLRILTSRKNGAAIDIAKKGIDITVVREGRADEYINPLINLATQKRRNKEKFYSISRKNYEIARREFDEKNILPRILQMFKVVGLD